MKSLVLPLSQNNFVSDDFKVILPFTAKLLFQLIVNFDKFNGGSLDLWFQGNDKQSEFEVKDCSSSDKLQMSFVKDLDLLMSSNKSNIKKEDGSKLKQFLTADDDQRKLIRRMVLERNTNSQKKVDKNSSKKIRVNPKIMLPFSLADGTKVTKKFEGFQCEGTTEYNKNENCYKITFSGELKERGLDGVQEIITYRPKGDLKWPIGTIMEKKMEEIQSQAR